MALHSYLDDTLNENTKTFTNSSSTATYVLDYARLEYTSNSTASNRQITLEVYNDSNELLFYSHAGAVQGASVTRHYLFLQGVARETSFVDSSIQVPIPKIALNPGWYIKVYDSNDVYTYDDLKLIIVYSSVIGGSNIRHV